MRRTVIFRSPRAGLAASAAAIGLLAAASTPAQAATLPEGNIGTAVHNFFASPDALAGVNDFSCKPTAEHPNPVVLLPAAFVNFGADFVKLAPRLKNAGYCVYATNFGMTPLSLGRIGALDSQITAGDQVAAFIDKVLSSSGAAKVDVVGHSQGGAQGINYVKLHGGADKVAHFVGWGQSSNGTTLNGVVTLAEKLEILDFGNNLISLTGSQGVIDQEATSDYTKMLGAIPLPSGPKYTTIQTKLDEVVTPYTTQSLPGATNVVLQNVCPLDLTGHIGLFLDDPTIQMTMNALADKRVTSVNCLTPYGPAFL